MHCIRNSYYELRMHNGDIFFSVVKPIHYAHRTMCSIHSSFFLARSLCVRTYFFFFLLLLFFIQFACLVSLFFSRYCALFSITFSCSVCSSVGFFFFNSFVHCANKSFSFLCNFTSCRCCCHHSPLILTTLSNIQLTTMLPRSRSRT